MGFIHAVLVNGNMETMKLFMLQKIRPGTGGAIRAPLFLSSIE